MCIWGNIWLYRCLVTLSLSLSLLTDFFLQNRKWNVFSLISVKLNLNWVWINVFISSLRLNTLFACNYWEIGINERRVFSACFCLGNNCWLFHDTLFCYKCTIDLREKKFLLENWVMGFTFPLISFFNN